MVRPTSVLVATVLLTAAGPVSVEAKGQTPLLLKGNQKLMLLRWLQARARARAVAPKKVSAPSAASKPVAAPKPVVAPKDKRPARQAVRRQRTIPAVKSSLVPLAGPLNEAPPVEGEGRRPRAEGDRAAQPPPQQSRPAAAVREPAPRRGAAGRVRTASTKRHLLPSAATLSPRPPAEQSTLERLRLQLELSHME